MRVILAALVLLLLTVGGAFAQTQQDTYRLQVDDIVRIQVYEHADILAETAVGRDGNITAPYVGTVKAEGRTIADLEAELATLYEKKLRIREPRVSVVLLRARPLRASVGGQVRQPGIYEFRLGDTLMTLLNAGGGALPTGTLTGSPDLRKAMFMRGKSQEVIPVDLYSMLTLGDMSQNYALGDGDQLIVPEERNNRIQVQGMVRNPSWFPYKEPMTLQDAISLAGGEVPRRSRFSRTLIFRQKPGGLPGDMIVIQADYVRYIKKHDFSQNIELRPGDMIYVPETDTPDINYITGIINSLFFFDRFFREGLFGFNPF